MIEQKNSRAARLIQAAEEGDAPAVARALADGVGEKARSHGLRLAAGKGHAQCVSLLMPVNDFTARSQALAWATKAGHAQCVKLLIPTSEIPTGDVGVNVSWAWNWAAMSGRPECMELLIPWVDLDQKDHALGFSARRGHARCVELLIPWVDSLDEKTQALSMAAGQGHARCVELLLPEGNAWALDEDGLGMAGLARKGGHVEVALMIESFVEGKELARAAREPSALGLKKGAARI
jgi:hypothetical protein